MGRSLAHLAIRQGPPRDVAFATAAAIEFIHLLDGIPRAYRQSESTMRPGVADSSQIARAIQWTPVRRLLRPLGLRCLVYSHRGAVLLDASVALTKALLPAATACTQPAEASLAPTSRRACRSLGPSLHGLRLPETQRRSDRQSNRQANNIKRLGRNHWPPPQSSVTRKIRYHSNNARHRLFLDPIGRLSEKTRMPSMPCRERV